MRKSLFAIVLLLVIAGIVIVMGLLAFQHRLIYFPRPYDQADLDRLPSGAIELSFKGTTGPQCAFYIPPRTGSPRIVWAMFAGNGSVALDWLELVARTDGRDGFLLVDYPGYGKSAGLASPKAIDEAANGAAEQLAHRLGQPANAIRWGVIGHSIGCAAGLQFAASREVERIILLSPFTTMRDMARRVIGWPLCYVLRHNFDNRARLAELAARPKPPRVTIFHGTRDEAVPEIMGRSLAAAHPEMILFHSVPEAGHNTIVDDAEAELLRVISD